MLLWLLLTGYFTGLTGVLLVNYRRDTRDLRK